MSDAPARDLDDLATARTLIATLQDELTRVQRENASLRHQLDLLCQRLFGKKSERVSPDQLRLAFAQLANEPGAASEPIEMDSGERPGPGRRRRIPPPGRRRLPETLPRQRLDIDIPEADKICACGHRKTRIGEAVTKNSSMSRRVCA
jgi:transposase